MADAEYLIGVETIGDVIDIDVGNIMLDIVGSESGDSFYLEMKATHGRC